MSPVPRVALFVAVGALLLTGAASAGAVGAPPAMGVGPADARAVPAGPAEGGGGLVHGAHHAFMIEAPAGWMFDNKSGVGDGLHAVAYRIGETYADSQALLYARAQDYEPVDMPTIDAYVATDLAGMRGRSPGTETFVLPSIRMDDGSAARVVGFRGDKWGNVEAVAYIALPRSIVVIALSARSQARFDADLPAFGDFVRSFAPLDRQ